MMTPMGLAHWRQMPTSSSIFPFLSRLTTNYPVNHPLSMFVAHQEVLALVKAMETTQQMGLV